MALVEQLKARGYRVLLADYLASPPAARVADEHVRVSTLAMDDVVALAQATKARLVIATCVDRANVTAAYVAERLGLPSPYSHATAARIANKLAMKQRLVERGIPTAPFAAVRSADEAAQLPLSFPVVVKPIDTGGSKGVRKATNRDALHVAVEDAFKVTHADTVIVEAFLDGDEVGADCFVQDGALHVLLLRRKYVMSGRDGEVLATYASLCPAPIPARMEAAIVDATRAIVHAFDLRTTPLLAQFIVDGNEARVIEFAPRVGGGTNHRQVLLRTGVDIVAAAIDSYVGKTTPLAPRRVPGCSASVHLYAHAGCFGDIRHADELISRGVIEGVYPHKAWGAQIGPGMSSSDRVASFVVSGDSFEVLLGKVRAGVETIDVVDVDGNSMLRRDVYLKKL